MNKAFDYLGVIFRTCLAAFLFLIVQLSLDIIFYVFSINRKVYEGLFATITSLVCIGVFILYHFIRSYKREKLVKFKRPDGSHIAYAVVIAFGLGGLVTLYMIAAEQIATVFAVVQEEIQQYDEHMDRFGEVQKTVVPYWDNILDFIGTVLFVPLAEELAFRGAVYGELRGKFNVVVSIIVSSLIFGVFHGVSIQIGYALICGVVLALIYEFSGSIWVSYLVHMVFNLFGSALFGLIDSGLFGDTGNFVDDAIGIFTLTEFVCILPAVASVILLGKSYKQRRSEEAVPV